MQNYKKQSFQIHLELKIFKISSKLKNTNPKITSKLFQIPYICVLKNE